MAELSSNWKKLQAELKSQATPKTTSKRKIVKQPSPPAKRLKASGSNAPKKSDRQPGSPEMGGVQSSRMERDPGHGTCPSLALWAENNDISSEALAEAYSLGLRDNSMLLDSRNDKVNHGLAAGIQAGKYVAMDCEMVGVGPGAHESALARVSLVDFHGRQIYDSYVTQREKVTDWRTAVSGVSRKEMRFARDFDEVQQQVFDILKDRILVGHDIRHDLDALKLSHPPRDVRDTARHPGFRKLGNSRKPALRALARELLGVEIQDGPHSSIEDARVTMLLFRKHKSGFDVDHASRYAPKPPTTEKSRRTKKKNRKS